MTIFWPSPCYTQVPGIPQTREDRIHPGPARICGPGRPPQRTISIADHKGFAESLGSVPGPPGAKFGQEAADHRRFRHRIWDRPGALLWGTTSTANHKGFANWGLSAQRSPAMASPDLQIPHPKTVDVRPPDGHVLYLAALKAKTKHEKTVAPPSPRIRARTGPRP